MLTTPHGVIHTPAFLPVGTQGTVKALTAADLETLGVEMILANAYHLVLRPGVDRIVEARGLHRFIGWSRPLLTDSGGFQVFSLSALRKVTDTGVEFQSHIDGSRHFLTPERMTEVQLALGADIIMCLDECVPYPCPEPYAEEALQRTAQWAFRCRTFWQTVRETAPQPPSLFGIVQGAMSQRLRQQSAAQTVALDFPGYAIGGLSVGEPKALREEILAVTTEALPKDKPRYLMGVGSPEDLWAGVALGVDLFDCVLPTRNARNGQLFTTDGKVNIRNREWRAVDEPVDPSCDCELCTQYTRAFLHHLFRVGELTALRLATLHNVRFLLKLMHRIQQAIAEGGYQTAHTAFLSRYQKPRERGVRPVREGGMA